MGVAGADGLGYTSGMQMRAVAMLGADTIADPLLLELRAAKADTRHSAWCCGNRTDDGSLVAVFQLPRNSFRSCT